MYDPQPPLQKNCVQAQSLLVDMMPESFQADAMPDADSLAFLESHLLDCTACQAYQEDMAMLTASIAELEEVPVPEGLADCIMQSIGQETAAQSLGDDDTALPAPQEPVLARQSQPVRTASKVVPFRWGKAVPIAAAILLLALVVPTIFKTTPQQTSAPEVAVKPVMQQPAPMAQSVNRATSVEQVDSSEAQIANASPSEPMESQPIAPMKTAITETTASAVSHADASPMQVAVQSGAARTASPAAKSARSGSSLAELDTAALVASVPDMTGEGGELYEEDPVSNLVGY